MDYSKELENPEFRNWIKSALGLKLTQQGLLEFIGRNMKNMQADIYRSLSNTCYGCTTPNVVRCPSIGVCKIKHGFCSFHNSSFLQPRKCPNNVCDDIRKEITNMHRYNLVQWTNTDAGKWASDYLEIAKCFLPYGSSAVTNITEADLSGLLTLIITCKYIDKSLTAKVDPGKNDIYHKVCILFNPYVERRVSV